MNSLLIVIRGGRIETIMCTDEIDLTVVDMDNYNVGEEYASNEYLPSVTEEQIGEYIAVNVPKNFTA
jgi:hypothetical protein